MKLKMRSKSVVVVLLIIYVFCGLLIDGATQIVCKTRNSNCQTGNTTNCARRYHNNVINITDVFYMIPQNSNANCSCSQYQINTSIKSDVETKCNTYTSCMISETALYSISGRYFIKYHCIEAITTTQPPTTAKSTTATKTTTTQPIPDHPGKTEAQTGSDDLPIVSIVAPITIAVVLALFIIAVVCIVRFKRQKNRSHDGIYADGDQNNSDNIDSFSNPAYVSDGLNNISSKTSRPVQRTS